MPEDVYPFPGVPVWTNPDRLGGKPCFAETRLPIDSLFGYLEKGSTIDKYLDCFEGVTREQVIAVLEHAARAFQPSAA